MKHLVATITALALLACSSPREPEYIVRPDGPRMSREDAQRFLVEKSLSSQIRDSLDAPLKVVAAPLPAYPAELRRGPDAIEGSVITSFVVNADGSVSDVELVGKPNPILAAYCLDAMLRWKFGPITRKGLPTIQRLKFQFIFRLEN